MSTSYPSNLSDAEWECLWRHLPLQSKQGRPPVHSLRAIFSVLRTGCPWRYLPTNFPSWQTVFSHFRRLRLKGTWMLLLRVLRQAERERQGRHPDPGAASMDSQSVKTVEESSGICGYDAHKPIKGRKRHLLVDTLGNPSFHLCDPCRYARYQGSSLSARRAHVLRAAPEKDVGRCGLFLRIISKPAAGFRKSCPPSHCDLQTGRLSC